MSVKTAVEDSMPPEIPTRSQFNEITLAEWNVHGTEQAD